MFDIGFSEMLLLGAIALIAIGPKQLPEVARTVGRFLNQLRDATGEFKRTIVSASETAHQSVAEVQQTINDLKPQLASHLDLQDHLPQLSQAAEPEAQTSFALTSSEAKSDTASANERLSHQDHDPRQMSFEFDKKES